MICSLLGEGEKGPHKGIPHLHVENGVSGHVLRAFPAVEGAVHEIRTARVRHVVPETVWKIGGGEWLGWANGPNSMKFPLGPGFCSGCAGNVRHCLPFELKYCRALWEPSNRVLAFRVPSGLKGSVQGCFVASCGKLAGISTGHPLVVGARASSFR